MRWKQSGSPTGQTGKAALEYGRSVLQLSAQIQDEVEGLAVAQGGPRHRARVQAKETLITLRLATGGLAGGLGKEGEC